MHNNAIYWMHTDVQETYFIQRQSTILTFEILRRTILPSIFRRRKIDYMYITRLYNRQTNSPFLEGGTNAAPDRRISCSPGAFAPRRGSRCDQTYPSARPSAITFSSPGRSGSYGTKTARWRIHRNCHANDTNNIKRINLPLTFHWIPDSTYASSPLSFFCRSSTCPARDIP